MTARKSKIDELLRKVEDLGAVLDEVRSEVHAVRQLVGPFAATFPDGSMLCQTIHNNKYFVDPDDLIITPQMIVYRQWEASLSEFVSRLCTPDTIMVDVGANFGYFTCLAGTLIGPHGSGRVFAFEPNPKLARLLRTNCEINWSMAPITVHQAAVADFTGSAHLQIPTSHGANATLSQLAPGSDAQSVEVDIVRIDDIIPVDLKVDLLKIDVEGHELKVLLGAQETIARSPDIRIVMEWSMPQIRDAGIDPADIVSVIDGFACYNADDADPYADRKDPEWLLSQDYVNALLARP